MEDLNLLRQVPFFSDLHDQDLKVLAEVGYEEHFPRDSIIIDEGQINKSLYFLVEGQVKVYLEKISGRALTLAVLKQGSLFGDDCLAEDERPSPKVAALQDSTVIRFDKNGFLRGISNDPLILANMLKETSSRKSSNIGPVDDSNGEGGEESQLHKEFPIFEKRFAIELEGIKLISKKIEDISNDTSAYIKDKSEETIAWVEQRSKEAIESSEKGPGKSPSTLKSRRRKLLNWPKKLLPKPYRRLTAAPRQ
jgi:CRP-like cAMP-binding protein